MNISLDYVRPTPWHKKRSTRRAFLWLCGAILIAISIYFLPPVWRRITILYYQDQCMNHLDEPEAIVATLTLDNLPAGVPAPACKKYLDAIGPAAAGTYNVSLITLAGTASVPVPLAREGRIFLHARTSKGGTRLITVDLDVVTDPPSSLAAGEPMSSVALCTSVIKPGTLLRDPQFLADDRAIILLGGEVLPEQTNALQALVIFAGEPDENDLAAFSIHFRFYGNPHIAKFRLNDTADKVEFLSMERVNKTERF